MAGGNLPRGVGVNLEKKNEKASQETIELWYFYTARH